MPVPGTNEEVDVIRQEVEALKGLSSVMLSEAKHLGLFRFVDECLKQSEILRVAQMTKQE